MKRLPLALGVALAATPGSALAGGSLDALAKEAGRLGPLVGAGVVVAAPLTSDEPASPDDLPVRLAMLVAGALGPSLIASPRSATLSAARTIAGHGKPLVFVRTAIAGGNVSMTAELYSGPTNVWDRIRAPSEETMRRVTAVAKIDAQARAFLPPLSLAQSRVKRFRLALEDILAAACGDIDGDGQDELLIVTRQALSLGHLEGGGFSTKKTVAWRDLGARAPVPLREPLGSAVAGDGTLWAGSTDYGGVSLSADLTKRDILAGLPVWGAQAPVCLLAQPSAGAFDGAPVDCAPSRDPRPMLAVPAPRFDAFAGAEIVGPRGATRPVIAVHEPSGRLMVKWGEETTGIPGPFGVEIAVGDLDQDGSPEVVTTSESGDAIDILTMAGASGAPESQIHLPSSDPVRAFAICPPGEHGAPALAAVTEHEVWILRPELGATTKGSPR